MFRPMSIIFRESLVTKECCAARKGEVFHTQLCHSLHFHILSKAFFCLRQTDRQRSVTIRDINSRLTVYYHKQEVKG